MLTLIHFASGGGDVAMEDAPSMEAALERAYELKGREAFIASEDAASPNGVSVVHVFNDTYEDPSGPKLVELHNAVSESPVNRFATKADAIARTTKALVSRGVLTQRKDKTVEDQDVEQFEEDEDEKEAASSADGPAAPRGRSKTHADDMVVVLRTEGGKNPKTPGKNNHSRFQAMMRVMKGGRCTVAEAVKAGATRGDLRYDAEHGYIAVVSPS